MMMCAALKEQTQQSAYSDILENPLQPSILNLQKWVEDAWKQGERIKAITSGQDSQPRKDMIKKDQRSSAKSWLDRESGLEQLVSLHINWLVENC